MALTPDVTAGTIVQSTWGNQIRDRTVQVFATVAERNTWAAPPAGAHCVTLDTLTRWIYTGTAWRSLSAPPRARVTRTGTLSIPSGAALVIPWGIERTNIGGVFAAGANTRLTVPPGEGGWWSVGASLEFATGGGGARGLIIRTGTGVEIVRAMQQAPTAVNIRASLTAHTEWEAAAGDYFECFAYHDVGSAQTLAKSDAWSPEFWASRSA